MTQFHTRIIFLLSFSFQISSSVEILQPGQSIQFNEIKGSCVHQVTVRYTSNNPDSYVQYEHNNQRQSRQAVVTAVNVCLAPDRLSTTVIEVGQDLLSSNSHQNHTLQLNNSSRASVIPIQACNQAHTQEQINSSFFTSCFCCFGSTD
ncbi:hypothetical protein [Candidatus Chromulinivorax destructor]|uniref:Uncharacterized protein n=1 Tax=Candidatus Chromulinivorax destructor TaxID=2066483 RepID=A0A345ZBV2_9BACT|nr:hypothetical protein [Candidatus Chromulinivorax destructor]AXK60769.1 hypothetical protein C0J27_03405 [Candidatus Chromulinivorax destructor]